MEEAGVFLVTQEPMIIDHLSAAENLMLGIWPKRRFGFVNWRKLAIDAARMLDGTGIDPSALAGSLDAVARRKLNILRAMFSGGKVIILDEPTAALTVDDRAQLFDFMRRLKAQGVTFIFISHFNDEILEICDAVSVLRDGRYAGGSEDVGAMTSEDLSELVLGRGLVLFERQRPTFSADAPAIHARLEQTFAAALAHEAKNPLPPLELVALAEENADLIPAGEAGRALAGHLADRLVALDLPGRALPVLQKLADATPPGDARSELGAKLASVRLRQGDAAGALASLAATLGVGRMKPALLERRTLIYARAAAAAGQLPQAVQALTALDTAPGDELRATLLEQARQWPGAEAALLAWTARVVPSEGMLTAVQATALLRLASAAAQAGDEAMLARLFSHDLPRIPPGNLADMFRLITAGPVQAVSDLGRAEQETKLASRIPDALKSLTSEVNPVGPAR